MNLNYERTIEQSIPFYVPISGNLDFVDNFLIPLTSFIIQVFFFPNNGFLCRLLEENTVQLINKSISTTQINQSDNVGTPQWSLSTSGGTMVEPETFLYSFQSAILTWRMTGAEYKFRLDYKKGWFSELICN